MFLLPGLRPVAFALIALALASCQTVTPKPSANRASFKANYLVARTALEGGQYTKAVRGYSNLLGKSGPLQPRIRLEYAHALLRAGKYEKASEEARIVSTQLEGRGRSAALAVQATADQEIARAAINRGNASADAIQRLVAARAAFDELLKNHPDMDPLGALALRRKTLDVELTTIR